MIDKSYGNWDSMSDAALAAHIGHFVKETRIAQNRTQESVAISAGISRSTLSLLEKGETVTIATLLQVLRVLNQLHVLEAFNVVTNISPLQLAKMQQKKRNRASGKESSSGTSTNW
jgi:transcriptional regulator with XRE-family HTH domain